MIKLVVRANHYGRDIYYNEDTMDWHFTDSDDIVKADDKVDYSYRQYQKCSHCGKYPTEEGYDSCLGHIDGADAACCGHGTDLGYIGMKDGRRFVLIDHKKLGSNGEYRKLYEKYYKCD